MAQADLHLPALAARGSQGVQHVLRAWPWLRPRRDLMFGIAGALVVSRLMRQALFDVGPADPLVYLAL